MSFWKRLPIELFNHIIGYVDDIDTRIHFGIIGKLTPEHSAFLFTPLQISKLHSNGPVTMEWCKNRRRIVRTSNINMYMRTYLQNERDIINRAENQIPYDMFDINIYVNGYHVSYVYGVYYLRQFVYENTERNGYYLDYFEHSYTRY